MSQAERKAKIDSTQDLPVTQQCKILEIARSSVYYQPKSVEFDASLTRQIDELYLRYPFYGSRRLCDAMLDEHGVVINRKRMRRFNKSAGSGLRFTID